MTVLSRRMLILPCITLVPLLILVCSFPLSAQDLVVANDENTTAKSGDELAAEYFRLETRHVAESTFDGIESIEDWTTQRGEFHRQLREMLGLDPMPAKTDLLPVVTGTAQKDGVLVQNVQFQSLPGLYVTGNFYRPIEVTKPLPAILYVCGHGREMAGKVSLGNKTHYQHHGAWFARNGYVCLMIDTIQLGEIEGIHHGTHREKMWWWNNRGYTPAGVEAFNGIRALDYLQTRDEVDDTRIGVTGRSGGGAYSWWITAVDDRVKVAAPIAGITNLKNHVVDGCVSGHCDCMFMVNTYRWDYAKVAALVAPRPLLIGNTDRDRIFPLDGVVDVHKKVGRIYDLYDAGDKLALHITQGPHSDTQELRVGAFRWFNRHLRGDESLIDDVANPSFEREQLKVFDEVPSDELVTTIHESFVPKVESNGDPGLVSDVVAKLRRKTFAGWPTAPCDLDVAEVAFSKTDPNVRTIQFTSQQPYRLDAVVFGDLNNSELPIKVVVMDQAQFSVARPYLDFIFKSDSKIEDRNAPGANAVVSLLKERNTIALIPRDVGRTRMSEDEKTRTHLRRRYMLLGQTLAGMQVYDVYRGLDALEAIGLLDERDVVLEGQGDAAVVAAYAALMTDDVKLSRKTKLPKRNREGPDLLNISKIIELSDLDKILRSPAE